MDTSNFENKDVPNDQEFLIGNKEEVETLRFLLLQERDAKKNLEIELRALHEECEQLKEKLGKSRKKLTDIKKKRGIFSFNIKNIERALLDAAFPHLPSKIRVSLFPHVVEDITLIRESEFFEERWYLSQKPNAVPPGMDAASHYYLHGARLALDPGPRFSTRGYKDRHADVARNGINPLVHYVKYGAAEGREIVDSIGSSPVAVPDGTSDYVFENPVEPPAPMRMQMASADEPAFNWEHWKDMSLESGRDAVEFGGAIVGYLDQADAESVFAKFSPAASAFCILAGMNSDSAVSFKSAGGSDRRANLPNALNELSDAPGLSPVLHGEEGVISDIWYIGGHDLRVRFDADQSSEADGKIVRFFQAAADANLKLLAEVAVEAGKMCLQDVPLLGRLQPILVCVTTAEGALTGLHLIPFPTLCRGGLHYSELLAASEGRCYLDALAAYSGQLMKDYFASLQTGFADGVGRLIVDLRGANGSEELFTEELKRWIRSLFGLSLEPGPADEGNDRAVEYLKASLLEVESRGPGRDSAGGLELTIPADSIPTIRALVAGGLKSVSQEPVGRSFIVADRLTLLPKWKVGMPAGDRAIAQSQSPDFSSQTYPVLTGVQAQDDGGNGDDISFPLSIRYCDPAFFDEPLLLFPVAPDFRKHLLQPPGLDAEPEIRVVVPVRGRRPEQLTALLQSLRQQRGHFRLKVTLVPEGGSAVPTDVREQAVRMGFSEHDVTIREPSGWGGWAAADGEAFVLFASSSIVLFDPRTIETLLAIAGDETAASVGCTIVHEHVHKKKGSTFDGLGGLLVQEKGGTVAAEWIKSSEVNSIFSQATYPVLANSGSFMLLRADTVKTLADVPIFPGSAEELGHALGSRLVGQGYINLCTSLVSVGDCRPLPNLPLVPVDPAASRAARICILEAIQ